MDARTPAGADRTDMDQKPASASAFPQNPLVFWKTTKITKLVRNVRLPDVEK